MAELHDSWPKSFKNTRIFYDICPKNNKIHEFYMILPEKNVQILHNNCPKNIFPDF